MLVTSRYLLEPWFKGPIPASGNLVDIQGNIVPTKFPDESVLMMQDFGQNLQNTQQISDSKSPWIDPLFKKINRKKRSLFIPESFDLRNHKTCGSQISNIQNQGDCANCWAHVSSAVSSDVVCMQSRGQAVSRTNSVMHLWSCCPECGIDKNSQQSNCKPGYGNLGFDYFLKNGLALSDCYTYSTKTKTPTCSSTCDNSTKIFPDFLQGPSQVISKHVYRDGSKSELDIQGHFLNMSEPE